MLECEAANAVEKGVELRANLDPSFVGLDVLKQKHAETLEDFRRWPTAGDWASFHRSHYDWWMFPIDEPSGFGFRYTVLEEEIEELKEGDRYLEDLLQGAVLLGKSRGWNLREVALIPVRSPDQHWQNWPIRLYKATKCVKLLELGGAYASLRQYGRGLLEQGVSFEYSRDLTWLFQ